MDFVDFEKAFDMVPREMVKWALRYLGVDEWIVLVIRAMYEDTTTKVRLNLRESNAFSVKVGVHQGSVPSLLLFIIVCEALSREFREGLPLELLYADDLVLMAETKELLMEKLRKYPSSAIWATHSVQVEVQTRQLELECDVIGLSSRSYRPSCQPVVHSITWRERFLGPVSRVC